MTAALGNEVFQVQGITPSGIPSGITQTQTLGQFGSGNAYAPEAGNIYKLFSAGTTPASTGADIVVATYTIPANSLDIAGRALSFITAGNLAANGNNKTIKIIVGCTTAVVGSAVTGGTTIATTGVTAGNNIGWSLQSNLSKYGAAGSNTQNYQNMAIILGTTHGGIGLAATLTLPENAPIICAVTINCATTATDASLWQFEISATN